MKVFFSYYILLVAVRSLNFPVCLLVYHTILTSVCLSFVQNVSNDPRTTERIFIQFDVTSVTGPKFVESIPISVHVG